MAIEAMHAEMDEQRDFLHDSHIRTIYFGGGTPSLVAPARIQELIDHAARLWNCSHVEELTLEGNPDDVTKEYVEALRTTSINRISLGVQSFDDAELRFMNRRHTAATAVEAVKRLQDAGIENITIDLIFGVDGFDESVLERSLEQTLMLDVQHVSAYHLTIEEGTAFHRRMLRGQMQVVDEERSEREYALVHRRLTEAGYEHYEISNFAKSGFRSRHNLHTWQCRDYLGLGVAAHSCMDGARFGNSRDIDAFLRGEDITEERRTLTAEDKADEAVMLGLRLREGIDPVAFKARFGVDFETRYGEKCAPFVSRGLMTRRDGRVAMTEAGWMVSNAILAELL